MNNGAVTLPPGGVTVVLGTQWGDEGKGKLVDVLCDHVDIVARCQGGNNAGHTIVVGDVMYDFHILPSGLVNPRAINLIGSGCVVHVPSFFEELAALESKGLNTQDRIFVSDRCHLVFDVHQICDGLKEQELGGKSIGTTKKGIGPAYSSKASRSGIRVHHLFDWEEFERRFRGLVVSRHKRYGEFEYDVEAELERYKTYAEKLRDYVVDAVSFMQTAFANQKRILCEGANAIMLDLDFGTYPYVTSSPTSIGGVCTGLGIPPQKIQKTIGVVKAYTTRVGSGPFPTEQLNDVGNHLQEKGREFGVTTGRRRRCGWLDLVQLRYSCQINGYTSLNLTKLDVLDDLPEIKVAIKYLYEGHEIPYFPADLKILENVEVEYVTMKGWKTKTSECTMYAQLPQEAKAYVEMIETLLNVKIEWIGVGPGRDRMLVR